MKTVLIVQARMNSARLPGKVLRVVLGKPLLEIQTQRLARVGGVDEIVVATSVGPADDAIEKFCREKKLICFRGSEEDVLDRFYRAAEVRKAEVVLRICADCPVIDARIVTETLDFFRKTPGKYDYVSNVLERSFPRGMDTEVFSFSALERAHDQAKDKAEREHVTPYLYRHPERFRLGSVKQSKDESSQRWTVDTEEDFRLIQKILESLYPTHPNFTKEDVIELLCKHPEWQKINRDIRQKVL